MGAVRIIEQKINFVLDYKTEESIIHRLRTVGCVFAEEETQLLTSEARSIEELMFMVEKRVSGSPIEYVLGFTTFCGLRIEVETGVFIPRRRTEFLVGRAIALTCPNDLVLDLCCGSGAVGAAIATNRKKILLHSVDIDPVAVRCASRNLTKIGGHVYQGDLYEALPQSLRGQVNIIVANVPYVPTDFVNLLPREARLYEPIVALDGGNDGLDLHRKVAEKAPQWLVPMGHLLVETSEMQAEKTSQIFVEAGLMTKIVRDEELDATVVIGTRIG
jgi:release factor glutamine methyltransferase